MLQLLCWAKPSLIKAVLKRAFQDLINALSECSLNIFKGHVQLTPPQKKQLCRYKQSLRALVNKGTSAKRGKRILQKGGLVGALVKPVLDVLGVGVGGGWVLLGSLGL